MGIAALVIGILGGLCAAWGIVNAIDILPSNLILNNLDWTFWFWLATILLIGCIALYVGRRQE